MITIQVKPAKKLTTKESLFVSFPFSLALVEKIKALPKRYWDGSNKEWEVPVANISDVLSMFQDQQITIKGKVNTKVKKAVNETVQLPEVNTDSLVTAHQFKTKPFQHQIEGFEYALRNNKFLLGDDQGLGKTHQAINVAVARKSQFKHCLIVCGVNGLKWNWLKEIAVHSNEQGRIIGSKVDRRGRIQDGQIKDRLADLNRELTEFFLITNVETLRNEQVTTRLKELCNNGTIGMVVIDEIHKCKNPTSQQGKAIHNLRAYYKMAMTGTPLMNNPLDLYNILKWIDVEKHSFYQFRNRYCVMGGFGGYEVVGYKNMNELRSLVERNMLRRKKEEVLDLPPKVRTTEYVEMTAKQAVIYKEVLNSIKQNIDEISLDPNPLAQLLRLRQATGHTSILTTKVNESAKIDRLKELVEEITSNGRKVVIFSNWTQMTNVIEKELAEYNPLVITGETKNRQDSVDRFQTDPTAQVIIGTVGAMGTGLTLTAATTAIFVDKPWNPANTVQAEDRIYRIGTTSSVNIITLVTKDTIDERIEEILAEKGDIFDALVEGKMDKMARKEFVERLLS